MSALPALGRYVALAAAVIVAGIVLLVGPPDPGRTASPASASSSAADHAAPELTITDFCRAFDAMEESHLAFAAEPSPVTVGPLRAAAERFGEVAVRVPEAAELVPGVEYLVGLFVDLADDATVDDITASASGSTVTQSTDVQALADFMTRECAQTGPGG
jgi:hypothetical protein